jgi:CubicO group peptidase (beta-lactamase class C family)
MARDSLPGLTIAVARGDSILWEEGFGWANRETRVSATPQTPFYLASLSKTITATALMVLREQGRLDLDRPANDYLGTTPLWEPSLGRERCYGARDHDAHVRPDHIRHRLSHGNAPLPASNA